MTLFDSVELGGIRLGNRVVMAPMTRSRAGAGNAPGEMNATYYGQRARAGLIITEGTAPCANGLGYPRIPGLFSDAQIAGWRGVTEVVHAKGGRIFVQLMHVGRVAHTENLPSGAEIVAPSVVELPGEMYTDTLGLQPHSPAREMTEEDVHQAQREFVRAAQNAMSAGFDGVEIHGANGYLVDQFLHPHTNRRADQYGGNVQNRCRFVLELVEQTSAAIGPGRVGVRLSPYSTFNDMPAYAETDETFLLLARRLDTMGIAYLHLCDMSGMGGPEIPAALKQEMRELFSGAMILCGGYDRDTAQAAIDAGSADLIAFARPFIGNPDLVVRMKHGWPLAEADQGSFYTPGESGYTDYPAYRPD